MQLQVASHLLMCSTLILGGLPRDYMSDSSNLTSFKEGLRCAVKEAEDPKTVEKIYNIWEPGKYEERQVLLGELVENFAFIIASTEPTDFDLGSGQRRSEGLLQKIGFKKGFPATTYNEKNETDVNLWFIRVSDFLEAIKE